MSNINLGPTSSLTSPSPSETEKTQILKAIGLTNGSGTLVSGLLPSEITFDNILLGDTSSEILPSKSLGLDVSNRLSIHDDLNTGGRLIDGGGYHFKGEIKASPPKGSTYSTLISQLILPEEFCVNENKFSIRGDVFVRQTGSVTPVGDVTIGVVAPNNVTYAGSGVAPIRGVEEVMGNSFFCYSKLNLTIKLDSAATNISGGLEFVPIPSERGVLFMSTGAFPISPLANVSPTVRFANILDSGTNDILSGSVNEIKIYNRIKSTSSGYDSDLGDVYVNYDLVFDMFRSF